MSDYTIIQGQQSRRNSHWISDDNDTWADWTTWASWDYWNHDPKDLILQIDDDTGSIDAWIPTLTMSYRGILSVALKVSDTGLFAGEETTYAVSTTPVSIVSGRYYRWTVTVSPDGDFGIPEIAVATPDYSLDFKTLEYKNLDTSTLSGTLTARTIDTTGLGAIANVQITAHELTPWVDRFYAAPDAYVDPTNITPVPGIVSKSPLTICLRDEFGVPVNGRIDILITGTPQVVLTASGVIKVS